MRTDTTDPAGQPLPTAQALYDALQAAYGTPRWWSDDPYVVMVQVILVQQTTWRTVEQVTAALGDALTPAGLGALSPAELAARIRPCGFASRKAAAIGTLTDWYRGYGCDAAAVGARPLAALRRELLALRGVGPETADVLLVFAFHQPSFILDAYTRRLLARLGYGFADDRQRRAFFEGGLPRDYRVYGWFHWLILDHCIRCCRNVPQCEDCCLLRDPCPGAAGEP